MNTPNKQGEKREQDLDNQIYAEDVLLSYRKGIEAGKAQTLAEKGLVKLNDVLKIIDFFFDIENGSINKEFCCGLKDIEELKAKLQEQK